MGLFALLLSVLDWKGAGLVAAAAFLFNLFVMPRLGRGIYRDAGRVRDIGILAYPAMVLLLILLFRQNLTFAAVVWAVYAFGDPAAEIAGRLLGGPRLPWNRKKTWAGLAGYAAVSFAAAAAVGAFVGAARAEGAPRPFVLLGLALFAAFLESVESGVDDNLVTPIPAAFVLALLTLPAALPAAGMAVDWRLAVLLNAAIAAGTVALGVVSLSGGIAGAAGGVLILTFGGWRAYAVLWTFFLAGTLASKLGYREKERRGTAQAQGGRRGARHVVANLIVPALLALLAPVESGGAAALAFSAAFAAALADTLGTEVGSLYGRRAFSPLTGTELPVGTPGAISWPGTLAGVSGGALVGLVAGASGLFPISLFWVVALCGLVGALSESAINDLGRRAGFRLDHEFANALNTFVGAVLALEIVLSLEKGALYLPIEFR
jgi:uncharacterized protein (TIGR00297 family)